MRLKHLIKSLEKAPIVKKGKYSYIINPITDGIPEIKPELLKEITYEIQKFVVNCGKIDKIVTMEAMGIPLATNLSINMNIPFNIIRKREYGLSDEICINQVTGYSKTKLYINGLKEEDRIVIVDDVLSTGGTLKAVLEALKKINVDIKGVFIVIDKGGITKKIQKESGINIKSLIKLDIKDDKMVMKIL
jgi:adenine phosphoribosyltransferase